MSLLQCVLWLERSATLSFFCPSLKCPETHTIYICFFSRSSLTIRSQRSAARASKKAHTSQGQRTRSQQQLASEPKPSTAQVGRKQKAQSAQACGWEKSPNEKNVFFLRYWGLVILGFGGARASLSETSAMLESFLMSKPKGNCFIYF